MGGLFGGTTSTTASRLTSIRVTQSNFGEVIPIIFGTNRVSGNLIDYVDFKSIPHTTTQGGKGGKQKSTTFTYTAAVCIALCEGPVVAINRVWQDKSIIEFADIDNVLLKTGEYGQSPWAYMVTNYPERALGYSGIAYVAFSQMDLGDSASLPVYTFELEGRNKFSDTIVDANPKDFVYVLLTNGVFGATFPTENIDDLTRFSDYCVANGLFISPIMGEQKEGQEWITDICTAMNCEPIWSQGKIKIIPYSDQQITGNGVTFVPNNQPLYRITSDDFLDQDEPIVMTRTLSADAFNVQTVQYLNRANSYNSEPAEEKDLANIELSGLKTADPINYDFICDSVIAHKVARLQLQRTLYIRNKDTFKVGWKFCLLDPMDIISLYDLDNALPDVPARVIEIKESEDDELEITVEEMPNGVSSAPVYASQIADRPDVNTNVLPGNANVPIIFDPRPQMTNGNPETWMVASSDNPNWGGANIWISFDTVGYQKIGTITRKARTGILSSILHANSDPDLSDILSLDLTESKGTLLSTSQTTADAYGTLCYVNGELIAYETATLTALYKYNLSYLRRGIYGTPITEHPIGSKFARLDASIFKYAFTSENIGKTIHVKLTSFNMFGANEQGLDEVVATSHTLTNNSQGSPNSSLIFTQTAVATIWVINHDLNKFPSVTIVGNGGATLTGSVSYIDENNISITFSSAVSGTAYLN